jgi:hypothetical protein
MTVTVAHAGGNDVVGQAITRVRNPELPEFAE